MNLCLSAQSPGKSDYYLFPINPGQQNYLAGTMGELRPSHFHAGIDVKTGGSIGLPIYSTADGYVYRIKVSAGGYGNALYLKHTNGTTSLYAHLDRYADNIERYVLSEQYVQQTFEIQLFPDKHYFPVKRGDLIGYSGNTGSSLGPHLHFEIRDEDQKFLDPLSYGFDEIRDELTPIIKKIAFVTMDKEARVNHTFGRHEFSVISTADGLMHTAAPIRLNGKVGIEMYGYDRQNGVTSKNGIAEIILKIDGDTIYHELKERMSFGKQREILVHMDYPTYQSQRSKFNKLFVDDGNMNDFYLKSSQGFNFSDSAHLVQIYVKDTYGNIGTYELEVNKRKIVYKPRPTIRDFEIHRDFMHLKADHTGTPSLINLYFGQAHVDLPPYRTDRYDAYYLWDLKNGFPDSVNLCGDVIDTHFYTEIPSETETSFHNHSLDLYFSSECLFDTMYLRFKKEIDEIRSRELFTILNDETPLRSSVKVTLKPEWTYPDSSAAVYAVYGNSLSYIGGTWKDGNISFGTRNFGTYTIEQDTVPPVITPYVINNHDVKFKIGDNLSGISSYKATINGQFLLMKYEPKRRLIWSERLDKNILLSGELVLEVTDNTGNKSYYRKTL
ncbi:M23 family metallopeptidase [Marinoscillum sp. MHG1-6]|uniref:M23 family metallopeptidase n=1 Tax=Marinoscillum sp. MHG1-6 TaxID=2959627 RepID=UPI0021571DB1|nr:M23 family metallopeptidase [Marinoscillum sp. MHG1-6]